MTKIYTLFFLFCLPALFATAQFDKGQKVLGGNLGFNGSKSNLYYNFYNTNSVSNIYVSPSIAWFTGPKQLFGIGLMYNYSYQKNSTVNYVYNTDTTSAYNHSIGINLFSQRFITLGNNFYFTVTTTGSAGYNFGKTSEIRFGNETNRKATGYSINASLAPGLSYRLTHRFLVDAYLSNFLSAGYTHNQYKGGAAPAAGEKSYQNSFGISSGLSNTSLGSVGLGFRWLLGK